MTIMDPSRSPSALSAACCKAESILVSLAEGQSDQLKFGKRNLRVGALTKTITAHVQLNSTACARVNRPSRLIARSITQVIRRRWRRLLLQLVRPLRLFLAAWSR